jgi:hypothetical protein
MANCARTDIELADWLRWIEKSGSSFLQSIAQAALFALRETSRTPLLSE